MALRNTEQQCDFNPRTHEECDMPILPNPIYHTDFNPRTHEECDIRRTGGRDGRRISIHALTKSATIKYLIDWTQNDISIHALTKSATGGYLMNREQVKISIHALTKSATSMSGCSVSYRKFQSTHSRRVRR